MRKLRPLKRFSFSAFFRRRFFIALCAGLLLACSFPKTGIAGFAWVAPGLMLAAALGTRGGESFRLGYVAGLAHYLTSLYWLLDIPVAGFPILGWLALSSFLSLLPAAWVWLSIQIPRWGSAPAAGSGNPRGGIDGALPGSWGGRVLWALFCAAAWVGLEMIIARIFGGFPWNLLGDSQFRILPLIQVASLTGVYGVSFLVAWTSVSLLCAAVAVVGRLDRTARTGPGPLLTVSAPWIGEVALPFATLAMVFGFGLHRMSSLPAPERFLNLTLVQPSIPQTLIWNPQNDMRRFRALLRLSDTALTNSTDLLIWPEAAMPGLPRYNPEIGNAISNLAQRHKVWMIIGADDAEVTPAATNFFNASFLVSPRGRLAGTYHKRSLVMFGEYIPLERWLPFVKWFTPISGGYTPGDRAVQFVMPDLHAQASVLICFEDTFPQLARVSAVPDTDFLVNITNDGWFGQSAAQWQHAAAASFRAVENGLPLVRCANTGITCWIDPAGRWRELFKDSSGSVYGAGFMTVRLPLPARGRRPQTFYNRHGDWFGWACVAGALLGWLSMGLARRRPGRSI